MENAAASAGGEDWIVGQRTAQARATIEEPAMRMVNANAKSDGKGLTARSKCARITAPTMDTAGTQSVTATPTLEALTVPRELVHWTAAVTESARRMVPVSANLDGQAQHAAR